MLCLERRFRVQTSKARDRPDPSPIDVTHLVPSCATDDRDTLEAISVVASSGANPTDPLDHLKGILRAVRFRVRDDFAVAREGRHEEARAVAALVALVGLGELGQAGAATLAADVGRDIEATLVLSRLDEGGVVLGDKGGVVRVFPLDLPPVLVLGDWPFEGVVEARLEVIRVRLSFERRAEGGVIASIDQGIGVLGVAVVIACRSRRVANAASSLLLVV